MAEIIRRDGKLFHGSEQIALNEAGPLVGIAQLESVTVYRDERDGRIVLEGSGYVISLPADVAAQLVTATAELVPEAKAEEVTRQVEAQTRRLERELAEAKERTAGELEAVKQKAADELEAINAEIEKKRGELEGDTDANAPDPRL